MSCVVLGPGVVSRIASRVVVAYLVRWLAPGRPFPVIWLVLAVPSFPATGEPGGELLAPIVIRVSGVRSGMASRIACRLGNMRGALVGSPRRPLLVFRVVLALPASEACVEPFRRLPEPSPSRSSPSGRVLPQKSILAPWRPLVRPAQISASPFRVILVTPAVPGAEGLATALFQASWACRVRALLWWQNTVGLLGVGGGLGAARSATCGRLPPSGSAGCLQDRL